MKAKGQLYSKIEFLSIGHFTHDIAGDTFILGGAAAYSSKTAVNLGIKAGVVSAVGDNFLHYDKLDGISLSLTKSKETTTFQNIYENGVRRQFIRGISSTLKADQVPQEWVDTNIVYICPVANEVDPSIVHIFRNSIIGVSPQGWMRQWDEEGRITPDLWKYAKEVLPYCNVLIMSEEDIYSFPDVIEEYKNLVNMVILTRGERGSTLFTDSEVLDFPAFRTNVTDPTGAGDVFATAFLIKYSQTLDPHKASIFANCTASFVVERQGMQGIPDLDSVLRRMRTYQ